MWFPIQRRKLTKEEKEELQNKRELEEYNRRQEKYNDMLRDEAQKQKFISSMDKIKVNTFTKRLVALIITVCIIDLQFTYLLAFFDKINTVESLSTSLCTTILGVAFVYMIRAYFDSKAEHSNLNEKIKEELKESLAGKINDTFSAAGININAEDFLNKEEESKTSGGFHINIGKSDDTPSSGHGGGSVG